MASDIDTAEAFLGSLAAGIAAGDPSALARGISRLERESPLPARLSQSLNAWAKSRGHARRIGITGAPGVGKSTLTGALLDRLVAQDRRIGVLAVDPSSPFTSGAVLGDRVRMGPAASSENVFVRSMATRGAVGGLAEATAAAADLMDAFGFDDVLIETVGVGQTEVEIFRHVDVVVVVLSPESGDGMQAMKAGVMEIGHIYVVNKADRPGAAALRLTLENELGHRPDPKALRVVETTATRGEGIQELIDALDGSSEYQHRNPHRL